MPPKSKSKFKKEEYPVLGGKAVVLRTSQSGEYYQFRMRIPAEKKYVRESLKTRDLETALKRAEERFFQIHSDVASGKKLFGMTLQELVDAYLKFRYEDVELGNITEGRYRTIKYQVKHFLEYKGKTTKVSELDKNSCFEFILWCKENREGVQDVTVRNEQATLNHMMKFAYREGYSHFPEFIFRPIKTINDEENRRGTFTLEQYDLLIKKMRIWTSKKSCGNNERLRNERLMIKDCILLASNSMLRVGELWQLKWKDIGKIDAMVDDLGRIFELVTIHVRPEISKTRKKRTISTRGGEYVKRLHHRSNFTDDEDYVFCGEQGSERFSRKKFYQAWHELMELTGIDYKTENITWYSLRHFGITCRLRANASIWDIAKLAGTSTTYIDRNYGHFDEEMARSVAVKNFIHDKHGISEV